MKQIIGINNVNNWYEANYVKSLYDLQRYNIKKDITGLNKQISHIKSSYAEDSEMFLHLPSMYKELKRKEKLLQKKEKACSEIEYILKGYQ